MRTKRGLVHGLTFLAAVAALGLIWPQPVLAQEAVPQLPGLGLDLGRITQPDRSPICSRSSSF